MIKTNYKVKKIYINNFSKSFNSVRINTKQFGINVVLRSLLKATYKMSSSLQAVAIGG